jgi:hypothetical protein
LVDHDADDDAGDAGEDPEEEEEEQLDAGHGAGGRFNEPVLGGKFIAKIKRDHIFTIMGLYVFTVPINTRMCP